MQGPIQLTFIDNKADIRWLSAENAARHRHSMFTDVERQRMSIQLSSSVPDQNPNRAIVDLESLNWNKGCSEQVSIFRGPFGAFKLQEPVQFDSTTANQDKSPSSSEGWLEQLEQLSGGGNADQSMATLNALETDICDDLVLDWPDLQLFQNDEIYNCELSVLAEPSPSLSVGNIEGWSLLSHYKDRIIPLISPLRRSQETPWMTLVIPCAMSTLAELTLNGTVNHARLALLNAVWSTSAFHLANNSTACLAQWKASGELYLNRAQFHFQQCMEESSISTSKMSKYKEILMAILSLSNAFMIKGDSDRQRAYLVQTEKFICVKGLSQPKLSDKRRALHHCYAYMRIMAETTCIANNLNVSLIGMSGALSDRVTYGGDFRIYPNMDFSMTTMSMEKDPEMAQRDIHLAIPGCWSSTLFPTVYGVDEIFLMLLSQVIRLANERDFSMMSDATGEMITLKEFWTRAKVLESAINHLLSTTCPNNSRACYEDPPTKMNTTAQAMYMALLIFFHRRIYEIDPTMLQGKVEAMRAYLIQIEQEETHQKDRNSAALIWPAFITACEAVDPGLQVFFASWFDCCARTTGLVHASVGKQIFETIWTKRRDMSSRGEICGWPDVLRDGKITFTCV